MNNNKKWDFISWEYYKNVVNSLEVGDAEQVGDLNLCDDYKDDTPAKTTGIYYIY